MDTGKNRDNSDASFGGTDNISVILGGEVSEMLKKLAQDQNITLEEALRRAIATEFYVYGERKQNSKILILTSKKEVRELYFRNLVQ